MGDNFEFLKLRINKYEDLAIFSSKNNESNLSPT